jgi:uncharacterized membrane protein YfcA
VAAREIIVIFAAGVAAGMINAVAGGGTLLSFPVLLWLGRDPIVANASNAVALWPGSLASALGFRRELRAAPRLLKVLLPPSLLGGGLGAMLLLWTPTRLFTALIPYLILAATVVMAAKRPLASLRRRRPAGTDAPADAGDPSVARNAAGAGTGVGAGAAAGADGTLALALAQLAVSIYGGYFGAAMGIMMLAALGLAGVDDIHQRNGLKNVASALINATAGVVFIARGAVDWRDAGVLAAGAMVGGFTGASLGRRLPARAAETAVMVIGLLAAGAQLLRR